MNPNHVEVDKVALQELHDEIIKLSKAILEIAEFMKRMEEELGDSWKDHKYFEFKGAYDKAINICKNIAQDYVFFGGQLEDNIRRINEFEKINVGTVHLGGKAYEDLMFAHFQSDQSAQNKDNQQHRAFLGPGPDFNREAFEAAKFSARENLNSLGNKVARETFKAREKAMAEQSKQQKDNQIGSEVLQAQQAYQDLNRSFEDFLQDQ